MKNALLLMAMLFSAAITAQVGIGTTTPNSSLDIPASNPATPSNSDGILVPRIDAFPVTNPTVAQNGMMVFLSTDLPSKPKGFYYWDNAATAWIGISGTKGWELTGNSGTNAATNFIGTTDDNNVIFKRNNIQSGKLSNAATSFGAGALHPLSSGVYNTAIGAAAMQNNTTGHSNTVVGSYALNVNTSGVRNTTVGTNAMYYNQDGEKNTAMGNNALNANTTGDNNVAIGNDALYGNQTGSNNTAIGNGSGNLTTTGSGNLTIGANTNVVDPAGSHQMNIAQVIYGTGTDMTTFAKIGIGEPAPKAKLHMGNAANLWMPTNADGIIISRVNNLSNPAGMTADQNGMMVFLTDVVGTYPSGFYYWDQSSTSWKGVGIAGAAADADFYEVGGTTPPDAISDAMFHSGDVGIGTISPTYKLDVEESATGKLYASRVKHSNAIDGSTTSAMRAEISGGFALGIIQGVSTSVTPGLGTAAAGVHNSMIGGSSADVYGVNNSLSSGGSGGRVGVNNSMIGLGTGVAYGVLSTFSNPNQAAYLGVQNYFNTSSIGDKTGIKNNFTNSTGGFHIGVNNSFINNNGAMEETGLSSSFTASHSGNIRGVYNQITNSGTGVHYGIYNNINGTGGVERYGVQNVLTGSSGGIQYGVENTISAAGNNTHYGTQNYLNGTGTGNHIGTRNWLALSGTGEQTGVVNLIDNTGLGIHKGTSNTLSGAGNGEQYGTYNYITNTGTGTKYGSYNRIFSTAGTDIHYGVYSEVLKTTGFAGYFLGRVAIGTTAANTYLMPATRGTSNQIITMDSFGNAYWNNVNNIAWGVNGNGAASFNFIGTTNDADVKFRRNNVIAGEIAVNNTAFGVGTLSNTASAPTNQGIDNAAFGYNALAANYYGNNCVAIGKDALKNNDFGDENVAVGSGALQANIGGDMNTVLGTEAMSNSRGLTWCTAIGYHAMHYQDYPGTGNFGAFHTAVGLEALMGSATISENSGSNNTALGYSAARSTSSGSYNVAIGGNAFGSNTTGRNNVAVGYGAANWGKAVSGSVAVGDSALFYANSSTTGLYTYNTAVGYSALRGSTVAANNTGTLNTGVGGQSLLGNTSGLQNSGFGVNALYTNTTGSYNTAVGLQALFSNSTGSGNVALGINAGYNETGSNKLYIDNSATAEPLIHGEFDNNILRANGTFRVYNPGSSGIEVQFKNSMNFSHYVDNNLNFGNGGSPFLISPRDGSASSEAGGIYGDGNVVAIWSPGDGQTGQPAALVYFLDEDNWSDNNGNPYDGTTNTALRAYVTPAGGWMQVSDQHKKENIVKMDGALDKIKQLNGYTYQFKLAAEELAKGDKPLKSSGVLAQELEKVLPEAVQKNENGDYFVDYAAITPLLIESIKAQQEKINTLEERLKSIEEKLNK